MSQLEFETIATCVQDAIEAHRENIDVSATLDVAAGLLRMSSEDRRTAIVWLCRSQVEHKVRDMVENLVSVNVDFALEQSSLDIAMLAIALCGAKEARELFPIA